jgi:hypothetical protein
MKIDTFCNNLLHLISEDKLQQVVKKLRIQLNDSPHLNEIILHSARLTELEKKERIGIINLEDSLVNRNKLRIALLNLIEEVRSNVQDNPELMQEFDNFAVKNQIGGNQQNHYGTGDNILGNKIVNN